MRVLRRLGLYGLALVAAFGVSFGAGTLVGPIGAETAPATEPASTSEPAPASEPETTPAPVQEQ